MQLIYAAFLVLLIWCLILSGIIYQELILSKKKSKVLVSSSSKLKIGLHRFDAFPDATGQLSFCFALIDDQDSGILLTSLHTKNNTRLYAKSIKFGQIDSGGLSQEEKLAMLKAI